MLGRLQVGINATGSVPAVLLEKEDRPRHIAASPARQGIATGQFVVSLLSYQEDCCVDTRTNDETKVPVESATAAHRSQQPEPCHVGQSRCYDHC